MLQFFKKNKEVVLSTILVTSLGFCEYNLAGFIVKYFELPRTNVLIHLDNYIPLVSYFVIFYILWYPIVFIAPVYIGLKHKMNFKNFLLIKLIEILISFFIHILFPTYVGKDMLQNHNIFDVVLNFIYSNDIGNAFPSGHVFDTWNIWLAYKESRNIGLNVKILVFITNILICCSTVFTKQHGIIDVFAAILLCEFLWIFIKKRAKSFN